MLWQGGGGSCAAGMIMSVSRTPEYVARICTSLLNSSFPLAAVLGASRSTTTPVIQVGSAGVVVPCGVSCNRMAKTFQKATPGRTALFQGGGVTACHSSGERGIQVAQCAFLGAPPAVKSM